ncbi:hypothetical protein LC653_37195, partial [Nostoc sp. CHAB 5784]|uniref:hypothetical protein n=1 Tax=Nostoc mirabile TaxID=2907820 RepID=UPI001E50B081
MNEGDRAASRRGGSAAPLPNPEKWSHEAIVALTFPVKSVLQAANLHRGRVILTNLATVPGYQLVFCFDVLGSR